MANSPTSSAVTLIANYLPQFHPIPENDRWWGPGFSEWTNVARARSLFRGHEQPQLPGELGFYDLRLPETRNAQAELARQHGISAFCYWHYWFAGRRLLERPFDEVLSSGQPDFPFCLGWANETWSGVWHGAPHRILMEQTYPGEEDYRRHFEYLLRAFQDPRYLRVEEKPLLLVFRPEQIPDLPNFVALFRQWAKEAGLSGLHLVGYCPENWDPARKGFDASTYAHQSIMKAERPATWPGRKMARIRRRPLHVYRYRDALPFLHGPACDRENHYPSIVPRWDNSPRCGRRATILTGATPELFRQHVRNVLEKIRDRPALRRIVFVKSWNEWAEGNYLEPDRRHGRQFLEVVRDEVVSFSRSIQSESPEMIRAA